jgi:hypothetical protein
MKRVIIDDTEYQAVSENSSSDIRIVILQRGWVVVGKYSKKDSEITLTGGSVIRTWGTTKGLGELAFDGPLSGTKLDPIPETNWHELTEIASIKCKAEKWKNHVR